MKEATVKEINRRLEMYDLFLRAARKMLAETRANRLREAARDA